MKILALKRKEKTVIPGFGLTFGISLAMLSILILIPLASILVYSFRLSPSEFWQLITEKAVLSALFTSVGCSFIAAIINCIFGVILAWVLVKYDFFGKRFLDGMLELPFALPTAVAGITLSKMYSDTGIVGRYYWNCWKILCKIWNKNFIHSHWNNNCINFRWNSFCGKSGSADIRKTR